MVFAIGSLLIFSTPGELLPTPLFLIWYYQTSMMLLAHPGYSPFCVSCYTIWSIPVKLHNCRCVSTISYLLHSYTYVQYVPTNWRFPVSTGTLGGTCASSSTYETIYVESFPTTEHFFPRTRSHYPLNDCFPNFFVQSPSLRHRTPPPHLFLKSHRIP